MGTNSIAERQHLFLVTSTGCIKRRISVVTICGALQDELDFYRKLSSERESAPAVWRLGAPHTVYGLCAWWSAELVPGVELSTSPFVAATHWQQVLHWQRWQQKGHWLFCHAAVDVCSDFSAVRLQVRASGRNCRGSLVRCLFFLVSNVCKFGARIRLFTRPLADCREGVFYLLFQL